MMQPLRNQRSNCPPFIILVILIMWCLLVATIMVGIGECQAHESALWEDAEKYGPCQVTDADITYDPMENEDAYTYPAPRDRD